MTGFPSRDEFLAQARGSTKVDFLTFVGDVILIHSKDERFAKSLSDKGAKVRWFDRTEFSTAKGAPPNMQAEILLPPSLFEEAA